MGERLPFFVYGTLLPGQPNAGMLLPAAAKSEPAIFPNGRLFDLGPFPMLLEGAGGPVHGLLVTVRPGSYEPVLRLLDALERFDPHAPADSPYRRLARPVIVGEHRVRAWVYLGRKALVAGRPIVPSGSWADHVAGRVDRVQHWWDNFTVLFPASGVAAEDPDDGPPVDAPPQEDAA